MYLKILHICFGVVGVTIKFRLLNIEFFLDAVFSIRFSPYSELELEISD